MNHLLEEKVLTYDKKITKQQQKKQQERTVIRHRYGYKLLQWIDTNVTFSSQLLLLI